MICVCPAYVARDAVEPGRTHDGLEARSPAAAIVYSPEDAATVTGPCRSQIFKAIKDKELTARKDGKATLEADELRRWAVLPTIGRQSAAA